MSGTLSVVATPIGNLEDVTYRAIWALSEAQVIVCEDTRVTAKLLAHLKIKKPLLSLHEHSDAAAISRIISRLRSGERVAYVCDAGTPNVNDPGGKLVAAAFDAGARVEPIPGPSALTAAISVCGFPMNEFCYAGFAPTKKGRATYFKAIAARDEPTVFFESTHRIEKTLGELTVFLKKDRVIFIGRELTKLHETLYRGTIEQVIAQLQATSTKGEFVVIVGPA